jgi:hypothetical protein
MEWAASVTVALMVRGRCAQFVMVLRMP